jgi:hypothetical protein
MEFGKENMGRFELFSGLRLVAQIRRRFKKLVLN